MDAAEQSKWQELVDAFDCQKPGLSPWDANQAELSLIGASHGEKCVIAFLLNVWNPHQTYECGRFDVIDACSVWDQKRRAAFLRWAKEPWWP